MSEDVIEQCESDLLDAQEAWILQLCRLGHMYVCMYVCKYVYICMHLRMNAGMHVCRYECIRHVCM